MSIEVKLTVPNIKHWEGQYTPIPFRDERGRIIWRLPGNTPAENFQLGIRNVQALFLEKFPEFRTFLTVEDEALTVPVERRSEAERFVMDRIGMQKKFQHALTSSPRSSKVASYFKGSYQNVVRMSFAPLGLDIKFKIERGKWNVDNIKSEAAEFVQQHGRLGTRDLDVQNRYALRYAIRRFYPGGLRQLQLDLAVRIPRKASGYWTEELTRYAATEWYAQYGNLSETMLNAHGRYDLINAIRKYPGRIRKLREDIEATHVQKPKDYWTLENIEREVEEFYGQHQYLSFTFLREKGRTDIFGAIKKYPDQMMGIKRRLGIIEEAETNELVIKPEEANEQLRKLLGETV